MLETPRGRCWGCGYDLRSIPSRNCPECGKAFDPDDARTMNMGKPPLSRIGRWLLKPTGLWALILAGAATVLLMMVTGIPASPWPSGVELRYYAPWLFALSTGSGWPGYSYLFTP